VKVALVGQSAGAATATSTQGRFARVAIAGFRIPTLEDDGAVRVLLRDPLLVVASEGDGVISLLPKATGSFGPSPGIKAAVDALPVAVARFSTARQLFDEIVAVSEIEGQENGATSQRRAEELRTAFIAYEQTASAQSPADPFPCHISFLSSRTNDAMVDVLSPLLPVARALSVPVLDFDVYARTRDSDAVAADLVPAVVAWLSRVM